MTMDEVRMRAIEKETREYGAGGPALSRKTAQEAADLIKNHRWFIFGQFNTLPGMEPVDQTIDQTEPPCDDDPPDAEEVVQDLMAKLEESVEQAKAARLARQEEQGEDDVRSTD